MIVIQAFLDLFQGVDEEKGLVMTESERKQLKAKELKNNPNEVKWTPRH